MGQKLSSKLLFRSSPNTDGLYTFYVSQGSVATQLILWLTFLGATLYMNDISSDNQTNQQANRISFKEILACSLTYGSQPNFILRCDLLQ